MKRILIGAAVALCALAAAAPIASARIYEVGASDVPTTTSCPDNCFVVTRTTALQVNNGGRTYPTTSPVRGRVVALTLQLGSLTDRQISFFNRTYGGTPRVQLTVLSQTRRQKPKRWYTVAAQSEVIRVTPYLGRTVQFPLETTLPIEKGDFLALTVPTWAPVLAVNLDTNFSWRASRRARCGDDLTRVTQHAQQTLGSEAQYKCLYQTARLQYSATIISTPRPNRERARRRRTSRTSKASRARR
jgi:hypothetical protein